MAFGEHLRAKQDDQENFSSPPEEASRESEDTEDGIPPQPEWLDEQESGVMSEEDNPADEPTAESGREEAKMVGPETDRQAHRDAFHAAIQDIIDLRTQQGDSSAAPRVLVVAKTLLDNRNAGLSVEETAKKAESLYLQGRTDGKDAQSLESEKIAILETTQMLQEHLEQSGIDLNLVAEGFQGLMEKANEHLQENSQENESSREGSASENLPELADEPIFAPDSGGLRVLTDVEYREIEKAKKAEKDKENPEEEEKDEEEDDDLHEHVVEFADNLTLLLLHMSQARTKKEMRRSAAPRPQPAQNPKNSEPSKEGKSEGKPLPRLLPRLPGLHLPNVHGMDYEGFVRNRRVGQISATRDSLLKMDRLMKVREHIKDPDVLEKIDAQITRQAKRLTEQGSRAFDEKGLDFMLRGGADPRLITDTMKKMEEWKNRFGNQEDLLSGDSSDALRKAMEKLAQAIQKIVDRVFGAFSGKGNEAAPERPARTAPTLD